MEEAENQSGVGTRHGGGLVRWVWITGLILVFYVLSSGPAVKLVENGVLNARAYTAAYAPLGFVYDHWGPARRFFDWYMHLWIGIPRAQLARAS